MLSKVSKEGVEVAEIASGVAGEHDDVLEERSNMFKVLDRLVHDIGRQITRHHVSEARRVFRRPGGGAQVATVK